MCRHNNLCGTVKLVVMTTTASTCFLQAYANLLKANIDGLRKREKKGKKSETSRSSSSRKATH